MEDIKHFVTSEYKKGNIIIAGIDGLMAIKIEDFITQDVEGMLYDLNRCEPVILTFLPDPKWINDFAVCKVIRALKSRIEELESKNNNE
jgi:hypothetical protein